MPTRMPGIVERIPGPNFLGNVQAHTGDNRKAHQKAELQQKIKTYKKQIVE